MGLSSFNAPYVHSSIYRFNNQISGTFLDSRSEEGIRYLDAQKAELEQLRNILKAEADAFLGGKDWRTIMLELDQNQKKMRELAIEILNSPKTISILSGTQVQYRQSNLIKAFPQIREEIIREVGQSAELTLRESTDIISKILLSSIPSSAKDFRAWSQAFQASIANNKGSVEKFITQQVKGKLTSEKGKIREVVRRTLQSRTHTTGKTQKMFISYFENEFRSRINNYLDFKSQQEAEDYLKEILANFRNLPSNVFTDDASSMLGKLGENFISIVMNGNNSVNIGFNFQAVGMFSEEKMLNDPRFKHLLNGAIKTHHKNSAESQTDLLITNTKNGKTIRAQSKNLQAAYQATISINRSGFPGLAKLQQETSYLGLIEQLNNTQTLHLSSEELDNLSYLLANEIWFRANPSFNGSGKARGVSDSSSILGQTVQMVNQLLTKEIVNFIGITIDKSITPNNAASSFNSFYLISNKILFPTYKIIEDIIQQIDRIKGTASRLSVTVKTDKSPGGAKAFYAKKVAAVYPDSLRADGNYTDTDLLKVGQEKGAEIIGNLSISNIGLKFDIGKLLETSWSF